MLEKLKLAGGASYGLLYAPKQSVGRYVALDQKTDYYLLQQHWSFFCLMAHLLIERLNYYYRVGYIVTSSFSKKNDRSGRQFLHPLHLYSCISLKLQL